MHSLTGKVALAGQLKLEGGLIRGCSIFSKVEKDIK